MGAKIAVCFWPLALVVTLGCSSGSGDAAIPERSMTDAAGGDGATDDGGDSPSAGRDGSGAHDAAVDMQDGSTTAADGSVPARDAATDDDVPDAAGQCGDDACPIPCTGDCFKVDVIRQVEQPIGNPTYLTNDGFDLTIDSADTLHIVYSYQDWWQDPDNGNAWTRRWRLIYAHRVGTSWQSEEIPDLGLGSTYHARGLSSPPQLHRLRIFVDDAGVVRVSLYEAVCCRYTYLMTRATDGTWTQAYDQIEALHTEYRDGIWYTLQSTNFKRAPFDTIDINELVKTNMLLLVDVNNTPWIFGGGERFTTPTDFEILFRRGDDDWVLDYAFPLAATRVESLVAPRMLAYPDGRVGAVSVTASLDEDTLYYHSRSSSGAWSVEPIGDVTLDDDDTELFPRSAVRVLTATAGPRGETHVLYSDSRQADALIHKLKRSSSGTWETLQYEAMDPYLVVPDAAGHLHLLRRRIARTPATIEYLEHVEIIP